MNWPWHNRRKEEQQIKELLRARARGDAPPVSSVEPAPTVAEREETFKPTTIYPAPTAKPPRSPRQGRRRKAAAPDAPGSVTLAATGASSSAAPPATNFRGTDLTCFIGRKGRAIGLQARPLPRVAPQLKVGFSGRDLTQHVNLRSRRVGLLSLAGKISAGARVWRGMLYGLDWLFHLKPKILIIERYLWSETITNFLIGTMGMTFFLIVTSVFSLGEKVFTKNIPPYTIVKVLFLSAPAFLVLAIPVAVVFSTLMAMARLNRDNELTAFATNGISLYRVFIPFIAMATLAGILTWLIYEQVVPPNNRDYKDTLKVFWQAQVVDFIKPGIVIKAPDRKYFYVDAIRKEALEGPAGTIYRSTMYDLRLYDYFAGEDKGARRFPRIFAAERAWVEDQFLVLSNVKLYDLDQNSGSSLVCAAMPEIKIDISTKIVDYYVPLQPTEMAAMDLRARIQRTRDRLAALNFPSVGLRTQYYKDWTEYYFKYSIPVACVAFVLVAVPLSLRGPRDERNLGLILTFCVVMIYYILFFTCRLLGSRGMIVDHAWVIAGHTLIAKGANFFPPVVAGWLTPALFIGGSFVLIRRARK